MNWVAIRMLTGDRVKFFGLIFGVTFATFLMSQQVSVFIGIVGRSASQIVDVRDASIWVMDRRVRHFDEAPGLPAGDLQRVRGVEGVQWAVPFYKGQVLARVEQGLPRNVILEAVDDSSLVGAPQELIAGSLADLRRPYAVHRRQGRIRISVAGRADPLVARVRDQRSPGRAGRRLQGVAPVRHAAGDVHPVQRGACSTSRPSAT